MNKITINKTTNKKDQKKIEKFLLESNKIESEFSVIAYEDALKAWEYLKMKSFITPEVILGVHHFLAGRIAPEIAGQWRNCDVYIGGRKKTFVSVQLIEEDVRNFILEMGMTPELPKDDLEEFTKQSHIHFEEIHPFQDFNGRTGRLLYLWHRLKMGLPVKIIHADMDTKGKNGEQWKYYQMFR